MPEEVQPDGVIPVNSFSKIFNAEKFEMDAKFSFLTIKDRLVYEIVYKDGVVHSRGVVKTKAPSTALNRQPQNP